MKTLRGSMVLITALLAFGVATAGTPEAKEGQSIDAIGQSFTTSLGKWELTDHSTSAGYGVNLNGKPVGYAVKLTVGPAGYPLATHKDGKVYKWTGDKFVLTR
jgi:hypothetical protein